MILESCFVDLRPEVTSMASIFLIVTGTLWSRLLGSVSRLVSRAGREPEVTVEPPQPDSREPEAPGKANSDSRRPGTLLTIGHSNLSWADFTRLLDENGIQRLVDVRSSPHSRRHPQFNRAILRSGLLELGIHYQHFPELGGLRRGGPGRSPNTAWPEGGFRNYADHMLSREFRRGVDRLLEPTRCATVIMCAEADPNQCHRRLLSDFLTLVEGVTVQHILGPDESREHRVHERARARQGRLTYPAPQGSLF